MNKNEPTNQSRNAGSITSLTRRATPGIQRVQCDAGYGVSRATPGVQRVQCDAGYGVSRATPGMCVIVRYNDLAMTE